MDDVATDSSTSDSSALSRWNDADSPVGPDSTPPTASVPALDYAQPGGGPRQPLAENRSPDDARLPTLDSGILDELDSLDGDSDFVQELGRLFLADAEHQAGLLDDALARGDSRLMGRAAHQLKGSAANVGAAELAELCSALPKSEDSLDGSIVAPMLLAIRAELGRVRLAFGARAILP